MRWTLEKPRTHKDPVLRRGVYFPERVRFCFVEYLDNEQQEAGDTLTHTFIKLDWPVCQTRYFYFWGTVAGEVSPSESPLFTKHRPTPPVPPPEYMDTFNSIEPELYVLTPAGAWTDLDLSETIHPDATGFIFQLINAHPGTARQIALRKKGQTHDTRYWMDYNHSTWGFCGVDADKKIEFWVDWSGVFYLWIMGFTGPDVIYLDEVVDVTPAYDGAYHEIDIHSHIPGAEIACFDLGNRAGSGNFISIREKGSTDAFYQGGYRTWPFCGVSADGKIEIRMTDPFSRTPKLYLVGAITAGVSHIANGIDCTPTVLNFWQERDVNKFAEPPKWAFLLSQSPYGGEKLGAMKENSYRDIIKDVKNINWLIIHNSPSYLVDLWVSHAAITVHQYGVAH